jgi:hypothetical protein
MIRLFQLASQLEELNQNERKMYLKSPTELKKNESLFQVKLNKVETKSELEGTINFAFWFRTDMDEKDFTDILSVNTNDSAENLIMLSLKTSSASNQTIDLKVYESNFKKWNHVGFQLDFMNDLNSAAPYSVKIAFYFNFEIKQEYSFDVDYNHFVRYLLVNFGGNFKISDDCLG